MRKILAILSMLLLCFSAFADEYGGGSYSGAGAAAGAQSQSVFTNAPTSNYDSPDWSERAPTIFVPGLAGGTNPCIVSVSAGVSLGSTSGLPGFGLSGGRAYTDEECNVRETLRLAAALTPKQFADEQDREASQAFLRSIACQSKVMATAMEITAMEHGAKYGCPNTLPEGSEVSMRPILDRGTDITVVEKAPEDRFKVEYASTIEEDSIFSEGSGFTH